MFAREPFLNNNLTALKAGGQTEAAAWLEGHGRPSERIVTTLAQDSLPILIANGVSQDSRRDPGAQAASLIKKTLPWPGLKASNYQETNRVDINSEAVFLFGLSGPALLTEALKGAHPVVAFESDPEVALALLAVLDLSSELKSNRLTIWGPWRLLSAPLSLTPHLLVHPAAKRRAPAAFLGFRQFIIGFEPIHCPPSQIPKVLIVPPLSGGSLATTFFTLRAAQTLGLQTKSIDWPEELSVASDRAVKDPSSVSVGAIFKEASQITLREIEQFRPHLLLALAQAPVLPETLILIKDRFPHCLTAFWFVEDFRRFSYVFDLAPAYDLFFHIQGPLFAPIVKRLGLKRAWYLPLAADPDFFKPSIAPPTPYRAQISFMGAGYPNRRRVLTDFWQKRWSKINNLAKGFKIFGSGWEGLKSPLIDFLFENGRRILLSEIALIYAGSEVNLNIHSSDSDGFDTSGAFVNPRTFELAASGAFQTVDSRPLIEGLFNEDELSLAVEPEQMAQAAENHLLDPRPGRAQALKARTRVLKEHTYAHRLAFVLRAAGYDGPLTNAPAPPWLS
ncbi:MAG: glycosyltransferase [Deltaproteobacteria bacterium]|jgi:spore maturation protein CgeB|nr:glycosyltransferase [Deltaproteobacteria bacterium]